jgi:hypothetical protein
VDNPEVCEINDPSTTSDGASALCRPDATFGIRLAPFLVIAGK